MQPLETDSAVIPFAATDTEALLSADHEAVRFKAIKHGILSRLAVLPDNDAGVF